MKSLIKTSIKRPVTICVLVVILLAVGVLSTMDMSTNLLPNINMPMLGITTIYPGAAASSVQSDVTEKLENVFKTIPGVTELDTRSYDNVAVCVLTFDYGTDIDKKIDDIEDALKTVTLPQGCNEPAFSKIDMNGTAAATISVYNNDIESLGADVDLLATRLRAIEGVGSVNVMGKPQKQIQITALQGLDITALAIVQALSQENLDLPLGTILQNGAVVSVRNASDATSVLQIMQLPVKMDLGGGATSIVTLKSAVKTYADCTLDEFNDYVKKALDARAAIEEIEGKTSTELEEQQDSLSSLKSLMTLLRENSSQSLRVMWHSIDTTLVQNEEFANMSDDDLRAYAESSNLNLSYDVLKWLQDGVNDGTLKDNWFRLVSFRECMEHAELAEDIPYDHFAYLFQKGGNVTYTTIYNPDGSAADTQTDYYEGLDLLHSSADHTTCDETCDREPFTHEQAVDACEFADSVNTVAYGNIVDAVREAEEKQQAGETVEEPVISDELFAALFVNSVQGNDFAALMSPQVIHIIRLPNFNAEADGKESIIDVLTEVKQAHVNEAGSAKYINGKEVVLNDDKQRVVIIDNNGAETELLISGFGRLTDKDGNPVDADGTKLVLTDKKKEENFYSYENYRVFEDAELISLYNRLGLDDGSMGITPTLDTVRFIRVTEFSDNATAIVVPVAYVGKVASLTAYESYSQYNGNLAVTLEVYAVADANTTAVVNAVKEAMGQVKIDGEMKLLDDKAEFINDSIMNVLTSIIIGGVLAVLVIYLFVGKIGSSLVVSITMPLSVLVALLGLWAMGISLNMVSLGGLAVGIGMLVDNSIVVLESITKRRDRGESVFDSCLNGTREVAGSLLASTLTNICVFFPILFSKGLTREIFYDLVWAVLFSIIMSLIVAVTVIPTLYHLIYSRSPRPRYKKDKDGNKVLVGTFEDGEPRGKKEPLYDENATVTVSCAEADCGESAEDKEPIVSTVTEKSDGKSKRRKKKKNKSVSATERKRSLLYRMENGYGGILSKVLTKRVLVCVVALVLFGGSVGLVFTTGTDFLPSVDKGVIEVNLRFNGAATLEEARDATKTAADAIRGEYGNKIEYASYTVGKQGMLPMTITGVVRVQTDVKQLNTKQTVNDIRQMLKTKNINATNITVAEIDGVVAELTGEMAGQSVTLMADDMSKLADAARAVAKKLENIEGVASVTDNTPAVNDEISLVFDKEECAKRGVDYQNAVLLLRVGMSGHTAANVTVNEVNQDVNVIFDDITKENIDGLLDVIVGFDADGAIKIADVLQRTDDGELYTVNSVVTNINKLDGKYVTSIDIESYNTDMGTVSKRVDKAVKEVLVDYPDIVHQEGGVSHYLSDAMHGLVISLIAAFLLLYGVMACQFESLVKPFIVIMSIPFSFTGGFLALVITGTTLNVVSFVGIIMLMGVIVNGAIVMIDKIDQLIRDGVDPRQAVVEGCKSRLRPILMTTLTTVLALIPLALGLGRGGELMQPMGIVVIGGLLLGTLVTLVLIPCFYCIVKRIKFVSPKKNGSAPNAQTQPDGDQPEKDSLPETAENLLNSIADGNA